MRPDCVVLAGGRTHSQQNGTPQEVFDRPASSFVMDFLGNVNVFHGRVHNGKAHVGPFSLAYDEYPHDEPRLATAYVRPHELEEIERGSFGMTSLPGRVVQLNPAGSVVKVRIQSEAFGVELSVDRGGDRAQQLRLTIGDTVYVTPRSTRVLLPEVDYAI